MHCRRSQHRKSGFTFVELLIGLMVTTMVISALAAFTFGVSQAWVQGDDAQSLYLTSTIAVERLTAIIRPSAMVLQSTGSTLLLWGGDANADGSIQLSETVQLRFDAASHTVFADRVFPINWVASQIAQYDQTISAASMTPLVITNSAWYSATALVHNVSNCQLISNPSPDGIQAPTVEIVLTINCTNPAVPAQTVYSTVALRAPNANPQ